MADRAGVRRCLFRTGTVPAGRERGGSFMGCSAERGGARRQTLPHLAGKLALRLDARIGHFLPRRRLALVPVGEPHVLHPIQETLGGCALGKQQGMGVQFDMVVGEHQRRRLLAHDGGAVHQRTGVDQHVINPDRMTRRDDQITHRQVLPQRAGPDADRQDAHRVGEHARDHAAAKPAHRHHPAIGGQHQIAGRERFHRNLACRGRDQRAGHEAAGSAGVDIPPGAGIGGVVRSRRDGLRRVRLQRSAVVNKQTVVRTVKCHEARYWGSTFRDADDPNIGESYCRRADGEGVVRNVTQHTGIVRAGVRDLADRLAIEIFCRDRRT
jgi:hypothetical protein